MSKYQAFANDCMDTYLELVRKEPYYKAWSKGLVVVINGQMQAEMPLVRLISTTRENPYKFELSQEEYEAYQNKVKYYLDLENAMSKMQVFDRWVRNSGLLKPSQFKEVLDPEAIIADSEAYLAKVLPMFPMTIHKDIREIVKTVQTWNRIKEYT